MCQDEIKLVRKTSLPDKEVKHCGRIEKFLKLSEYLKEWRTISEIADEVSITRKSVYNYLNLLASYGYTVWRGRCRRRSAYKIEK